MLSNNEPIQTFSEKYFCLIPMAFSEPWRNNAAKQADARPPAGHAIPALPGRPLWLPPSRKAGPQCRLHCGPASTVNAVTAPSCRAWAFSGRTWGRLRPPTQGPAAAVAHLARYFSACERMSSASSK